MRHKQQGTNLCVIPHILANFISLRRQESKPARYPSLVYSFSIKGLILERNRLRKPSSSVGSRLGLGGGAVRVSVCREETD